MRNTKQTKMTKVNAYFEDIREEILKVLDNAESSIQICMAWLTDKVLMQKLLDKLDSGVDVEICMFDHDSNKRPIADVPDSLENLKKYWADLKTFQEKNGTLNIVPQEIDYVHHKFAVVDGKITITGSYNWTKAAISHKENIVIIEDELIAQKFLEHLKEIVSVNHSHIINSKFQQCTSHACVGRILKIKIIDFRSSTKYYQNDTFTIGICTADEHIETITDTLETDYIGDLIQYEFDQLEGELEGREFTNKENIIKRRIESKIAWSLDSRLDVFVNHNSHDILGLYKIVHDIDGDEELKAIWEHDLVKPYFIESWENEIIEHIDSI